MKKKKKVRKNLFLQRGSMETFLLLVIVMFAVLITGYLTFFNSSTFNNEPFPDSDWVYRTFPTQPVSEVKNTLQEHTISSVSIPKKVLSFPVSGANESNIHTYGLKPNPKFYSPSAPIEFADANVRVNQNFSHHFVKKAYAADPPVADAHLASYIPIPGYQGPVASCTTWVIGYGMLGTYASLHNYYPASGSNLGGFAPMYLYSQDSQTQTCTGSNCGTAFADGFSILTQQGIDRRDHYFQGDYDFSQKPDSGEQSIAGNYKISGFTPIFSGSTPSKAASTNANAVTIDDTSIKNAIYKGNPVALGIHVLSTFTSANPTNQNQYAYIIKDVPGETSSGLHAVMAFAYDQNGVWIENSWATSWGLKGTGELTWDYVNNQAVEAYTMAPVKPATLPSIIPLSTLTPTPLPPNSTPTPTPPVASDPCSTLNLSSDPVNCGLNGGGIGLFCGGSCGVGGNPAILYQCKGTTLLAANICSRGSKCIPCPGAPHADQCGTSTNICSAGSPFTSITPVVGVNCRKGGGACAPANLCGANCKSCNVGNDCQSGYQCCH